MKTPLRYQVTRHDCGPTSMVNALMYLFEREEIHPELLQYITAVTIDRDHGKGAAPGGTSGHALDFLAWWLNDYAKTMGFPLRCEALPEDQISMREGFALRKAVEAVIEAASGNRSRFMYETADLAYHMLVLMESMGVSVSDLEQELMMRHK